MSKLLGLDYGEKRIGVALAEGESKAIAPFKILKNNKNLFAELKKMIKEEEIKEIIVGLPLGLKNQETKQTEKVKNFINKLKKEIIIPIKTEDERLTSQLHKNLRKKKVDALSAMSILDSYLTKK